MFRSSDDHHQGAFWSWLKFESSSVVMRQNTFIRFACCIVLCGEACRHVDMPLHMIRIYTIIYNFLALYSICHYCQYNNTHMGGVMHSTWVGQLKNLHSWQRQTCSGVHPVCFSGHWSLCPRGSCRWGVNPTIVLHVVQQLGMSVGLSQVPIFLCDMHMYFCIPVYSQG
jgi:hypothetical protein